MALSHGRSGCSHRIRRSRRGRAPQIVLTVGTGITFTAVVLASGATAASAGSGAARATAVPSISSLIASPASSATLPVPALTTSAPTVATQPTATSPIPRATATTAATFTTALTAAWRSYLAGRPGSISVALYDENSDQTVYVTKNRRTGWETASTVKLDILADLLSKTGTAGTLPASQLARAKPMISVSDNNAASALWRTAGGTAGMNAFYRSLGMTSTTAGSGGYWGLTETTALDQLKVLRAVSYPGPYLSANARSTATSLLNTVIPAQRWGLTAGVPASVSVQLKNGWLPHGPGWVVNSLAHVHGAGKDYVMAVYTRDSATEQTGINTIAGLSRIAWSAVPTGR
ncbi:hypothetical protein FraEuI1c_0687 [Pseudofrankia inefficax]|uniref:Beta-lactamase class A catalytic domain-containing protein n=1 Tax=Pseudofrankia inefficax (strain DSM 45817 / CECT 9037 / DDB 130130 / EuI1c) TaxID=298654 RepID=E3ITK8_PSEI1|nr:hypothetical protein FraEuI1c_0687 [Pseudofrankia inefficax]